MNHIKALLQSLFIMSSMVEARDSYTGGHLWRVSQFSRLLAEAAGLDSQDTARISAGGFLHDLGKIGIPDAILGKPEALTHDEYAIIKTHPEIGAKLLGGHPLSSLVMDSVQFHHEQPSGKGYPHGLIADQIPLDARIVGVCDAFDAMTSHRPYRQGMSIEKALSIIESELGKQFDQHYGEVFLKLGRKGILDHIVGHSELGIPLQKCPICGPTIVITRQHKTGDHTFCRHCGGEARVERLGQQIHIKPTGRKGTASELEVDIDLGLIEDLVKECSKHLQTSYI
ncbi:MAG: HD-GYP domain-containing protein [Mariprofundaceae bacterium]